MAGGPAAETAATPGGMGPHMSMVLSSHILPRLRRTVAALNNSKMPCQFEKARMSACVWSRKLGSCHLQQRCGRALICPTGGTTLATAARSHSLPALPAQTTSAPGQCRALQPNNPLLLSHRLLEAAHDDHL